METWISGRRTWLNSASFRRPQKRGGSLSSEMRGIQEDQNDCRRMQEETEEKYAADDGEHTERYENQENRGNGNYMDNAWIMNG